MFAVDADGTIVYRDRDWPDGRDDQGTVPTLSDNYCPATLHTWDTEVTTDDDVLINDVTLTQPRGRRRHRRGRRVDRASRLPDVRRTAGRRPVDTRGRRPGAGRLIVARRADHYLRVNQYVLYVNDPQHAICGPWPSTAD